MLYLTLDGKYILNEPITIPGTYDVDEKKCFICDDLMCPIISELLKKGYTTEFCCSGHYSNSYVKSILENAEHVVESWDDNQIINYSSIIELCKAKEVYLDPYIKFSRKIKDIPKPPTGWNIEYSVVRIDRALKMQYVETLKKIPTDDTRYNVILRHKPIKIKLTDTTNPYDIMRRLVDMNESLYKWVLTLSDYEEE